MQKIRDADLKARNLEQAKEIFTADNRYLTGEEVGRSPTDEEMVRHYFANGGPDGYRKRHRNLHRRSA